MKLWKTERYWGCLFLFAFVALCRGYDGWGPGLAYAAVLLVPGLAIIAALDRPAPLGPRIWLRAIGWGMLVVPMMAGVTQPFFGIWFERAVVGSGWFEPGMDQVMGSTVSSVLSAPLSEELFKGLLPLLLLWSRSRPIMGPWQGMMAGSLAALAYGSMETGLHFASLSRQPGAPGFFEMMGQTRSTFPFLHVLLSMPMSFAIGAAAWLPTISRRVAIIVTGWLISGGLHGLWNWEALLGKSDLSLVPAFRHLAILSPLLVPLILAAAYLLETRSLEHHGLPPGRWWPRQPDLSKVRRTLWRRLARHLKRSAEPVPS